MRKISNILRKGKGKGVGEIVLVSVEPERDAKRTAEIAKILRS